jgi:hypothetical protein
MRKVALTVTALLVGGSSLLFAQKSVEAGIFLDYLSISQTNTSNFGLGGRLGYRVRRNVMIEGELAYDYGINFNETYRNITNGDLTAIERTSIRCHTWSVRCYAPARERWISSIRDPERRVHGFPP